MPEFLFNTETGRLYVGAKAAEPDIAEFGPKIVPLSDLIDLEALPFPTDHFEKDDFTKWERTDYGNFGRWVICVLANINPSPGQPILLTRHMKNLNLMGIGPSLTGRFTRLFGGFDAFKVEFGMPTLRETIRYKHWSTADFVQHARTLASRLRRRPHDQDYDDLYRAGEGPGLHFIYRRVGGLNRLHELIGYPNIADWDNDDFVLWGVRALRANPNTGVTRHVIDHLSKQHRGPCTRTVVDRFGKLSTFQQATEDELKRQDEEMARDRAAKTNCYHKMIASGQLSVSYQDAPVGKLLAIGARRLVIEKLAFGLTEKQKQTIATMASNNLIPELLAAVPGLDAGGIEARAVTLGVFDDIWPLDTSIKDLRVDLPRGRGYEYANRGSHRRPRTQKPAS